MNNESLLAELGLQDLPDDKKQEMAERFQVEIEERVGEKLLASMSDEQLVEFETIVDQDADTIQEWLDKNRPDYATVVSGVVDDLKEEIAHNRDVISGKQ